MKKFIKNCKAATAIEFAIIAPVFFFLLVGIMEFGLTIFYDSSLNTGIRAAARKGVPYGFNNTAEIEDVLNDHLGGLYDNSRGQLIILAYDDFDSADFTQARREFVQNPEAFFGARAGSTSLPTTQSGKIIVYGVRYRWGGLTNMLSPFIPQNIYSFSIVRNEAF